MRKPPSREPMRRRSSFSNGLWLLIRGPPRHRAHRFCARRAAARSNGRPCSSACLICRILVDEALRASPRRALAHLAKGAVLRALSRPEEAGFEYEMASGLQRNWPTALSQIGWCKLLTGSLEDAIPLHERAMHLSPRDPQELATVQGLGSSIYCSRAQTRLSCGSSRRATPILHCHMRALILPLLMPSGARPGPPRRNSTQPENSAARNSIRASHT